MGIDHRLCTGLSWLTKEITPGTVQLYGDDSRVNRGDREVAVSQSENNKLWAPVIIAQGPSQFSWAIPGWAFQDVDGFSGR